MTDTALDRLRALMGRATEGEWKISDPLDTLSEIEANGELVVGDVFQSNAALIVQSVKLSRLLADPETAEQMARAHDREDAAQKGEPSPWDFATDADDFEGFKADRVAAMQSILEYLAQKAGE